MNYYEIILVIYVILLLLFLGRNIHLVLRKPEKLREYYLIGVLLFFMISFLPLLNANASVMKSNIVQFLIRLIIIDIREKFLIVNLSFISNIAFIISAICYMVIIFMRTLINIKRGISPNEAVSLPIGFIYSFLWLMMWERLSVISSWYVLVLNVFLIAYILCAWYYVDIKSIKGIIRCIRGKKLGK